MSVPRTSARRPTRLPAMLFLVGLVLAAAPGRGSAQDLGSTIERVASAWQRGDAGSLTGLAARAGISLDVDGRAVGPLPARQAGAVLRRVFEERESVGVRPTMNRTVAGSPPSAFAEFAWTVKARGTTIPESARLFIAFVLEDERWRISEIRLLR
jgi:hypothetical protein